MAYSTQTAVSDGTLESLSLSIEYIDQENITVIVDLNDGDGPQEYTPGTIWDWVGTEAIQFEEPLPTGAVVVLRRASEMGAILNKFTTGAMFNAPTLDENFEQLLYLVQEAREGSGLTGVFNDLDMHGFKFKNLGRATGPGDAVRLDQIDEAVYGTPAYQEVRDGLDAEIVAREQGDLLEAELRREADEFEARARQAGDAALQAQLDGGGPLTSSAFSPISWHDQIIPNSVLIPPGKNAWSFGPRMTIAPGQAVEVGVGSYWTIANGEVQ